MFFSRLQESKAEKADIEAAVASLKKLKLELETATKAASGDAVRIRLLISILEKS